MMIWLPRAVVGGEVNGIPVALRVTTTMRKGVTLTLGLSSDRGVVGRWSPRMPRTMRPDEFWPRVNAAIAALAVAAAARPNLLFAGWSLAIPPAPVPRHLRRGHASSLKRAGG